MGARATPTRMSVPSTRERILEAGIDLISQQGYAATGVAQVCERAGVAKTALYWHFGSKDGLLGAVVEALGSAWIERIQKAAYLEADAPQRINRLAEEWRRILIEEPQLIRVFMVVQLEHQQTSDPTREAFHRVLQRAMDALVQGIEDTVGLALPDLDLLAHTILSLLQGACLRQILEPDEAELDRVLGELKRTVLLLIADRLRATGQLPVR